MDAALGRRGGRRRSRDRDADADADTGASSLDRELSREGRCGGGSSADAPGAGAVLFRFDFFFFGEREYGGEEKEEREKKGKKEEGNNEKRGERKKKTEKKSERAQGGGGGGVRWGPVLSQPKKRKTTIAVFFAFSLKFSPKDALRATQGRFVFVVLQSVRVSFDVFIPKTNDAGSRKRKRARQSVISNFKREGSD